MIKRITIDPVTRVEGHLRIDVEVDGGAVRDAWTIGTMWRGLEVMAYIVIVKRFPILAGIAPAPSEPPLGEPVRIPAAGR